MVRTTGGRRRRWLRASLAALTGFGLLLGTTGGVSADRDYSWTLDKDGKPLQSPLPYIYDFEIDGMYKESGTFKNPADIFVDKDANVWIADTGNNRLVEFDPNGKYLREVGTADDQGKLNAP